MKVALEELRLFAHDLAKEKKYDEAVDMLLEIKKKTKVYTWDVAFYVIYYQILEEKELKQSLTYINNLNQVTIEALSIIAIHLNEDPRTKAPFEIVHDKVMWLAKDLMHRSQEDFIDYIERYKLTSKQKTARKEEYITQLKTILTLSETYINSIGNLVEFIPIDTEFMWNFFKLNDEIYCKILPYMSGTTRSEGETKRNEIIQIIQLKYQDYEPCIEDDSILQNEKNKWWQFNKN